MKYGHEDKKTGIGIDRDVYGEHFDDEVHTNYMLTINGEIILEMDDPKTMADHIMKMNERLYKIADFLRRKNVPRGTIGEPTGDK